MTLQGDKYNDSGTGHSDQQRREWVTSRVFCEGQEGLMIIALIEHLLCTRHHSKYTHVLTNITMHETSTIAISR